MTMSCFLSKKKNTDILTVMEAFAVFVLVLFALHVTNTSTGAGYLLYIRSGVLSRSAWDMILELILILLMLVLLIVPSLIIKADPGSIALFFLSVCGFTAYLRPDRLLAPFTGGEIMSRGDIVNSVFSILPVWIVCGSFQLLLFADAKGRELKLLTIMALISVGCLIIGALTPAFEIFLFASGYFLNLPVLEAGKRQGITSDPIVSGLIPGTVLCLRSVWRLLLVLSTYHM